MDQALLVKAVWLVSGALFSSLTVILQLYRRQRYLTAALDRLQQRRIEDANETWRIACTAFASGEPITLEDLLNKREADFSLRSSKT